MNEPRQFEFDSFYFDQTTINAAMHRILIPLNTMTSEQRWTVETQYLLGIIEKHWNITPETIILDYGCGVGRIARALIDRFNCYVVGVDPLVSMRQYADQYVSNSKFLACSPQMLNKLDIRFDYAMAIWVLLHCHAPTNDISLIKGSLMHGGQLFVVNEKKRVLPTTENIAIDDGINIQLMLDKEFKQLMFNNLDYANNTKFMNATYWAMYENL